jgi:hypothetical protein
VFNHGGTLPTMAFVVARPNGRFEIRESRSIDGRPQSRTLASFRVLDDDVVEHARSRAETPFDVDAVRRSARARGAPVAPPRADLLVNDLLVELDGGATVRPAARRLLERRLAGRPADPADHHLARALSWRRASTDQRGEALVDLLSLVDAVGPRSPGPRAGGQRRGFPHLHRARRTAR